jgi:hypothetical protein
MALGLNESTMIGSTMQLITENITGSLVITGLVVVLILVALFITFRLPIELILIFFLPALLVFVAFNFLPTIIAGVVGIILAFFVAWAAWAWFTNK